MLRPSSFNISRKGKACFCHTGFEPWQPDTRKSNIEMSEARRPRTHLHMHAHALSGHNQKLNEFYSSSATGSPRASRQQICNLNNLTSLQETYQPTNHLMSCCCHPCPKNGITRCYNHLQLLFCTFMRFWHVQAQELLPLATTTAWSRVWRVASDTQAISWCIELMNIPLGWPTGHRTFAVSSLARLLKTSKATVSHPILPQFGIVKDQNNRNPWQ